MHHKVIIIDDATVITGSYNFTRRAAHTNDENLLIIDSPALAAQFAAEFERVYRQARNPPRCE
jgi:phosphatidylserine/phosphatidylglycerophosphate/cardiolipin synthase-like enzyme